MPPPKTAEERLRMLGAACKGPGPAAYLLPPVVGFKDHDQTKKKEPAHQLGLRLPSIFVGSDAPGPKYGLKPHLTRTGSSYNPKFSIHGRENEEHSSETLGPNAYNVTKCPPIGYERRPPAFSFGHRTKIHNRNSCPAPNHYKLPAIVGNPCDHLNVARAPCFSLASRKKLKGVADTPGPAQYDPSKLETYKETIPAVSLKKRVFPPSDDSRIPGPGAHRPENCKLHLPHEPHFSFGIRYSPYVSTYIVEVPDE